jgi:hypothetical protein
VSIADVSIAEESTLSSIVALLASLDASKIRYVHWKSNVNAANALAGKDDLDLLVHPSDRDMTLAVLRQECFVEGIARRDAWHTGMSHHFAPDLEAHRLVHVHLHDRLMLGFDFDKNYTLPVVDWYLSESRKIREMRVPAPERELILFTIRTLIKHARSTRWARFPVGWRSLLSDRPGELSASERSEFLYLSQAADLDMLKQALAESKLPIDESKLITALETCLSNPSSRQIQRLARTIKHSLAGYRNRAEATSFLMAAMRLFAKRLGSVATGLGFAAHKGRKFDRGGRIVAFLGGDGAGKSSNVDAVHGLMQRYFHVEKIHVGRPNRSIRGALFTLFSKMWFVVRQAELGQSYRHLALATDRIAAFRRAERVRSQGGIAVLDRLPTPWVKTMDAPRIVSPTTAHGRYLALRERRIYGQFKGVDLLVVLRLNPQMALRRRPEDDPDHLMARSGEIWNQTWTAEYMFSIDTGDFDLPTVVRRVTRRVWDSVSSEFIRTEVIGLSGAGKSTAIKNAVDSFSNVRVGLPYWSRPWLLVRCAILQAATRVPRSRIDREIFREMVQLRWFVAAQGRVRSPHGSTAHHYILDQGPVFQLARGLVEGCISQTHALYRSGIAAVNGWQTTDIVRLRAPKEVRFGRLKSRPGRLTRSMRLSGDSAEIFNRAYRNAFRLVCEDLNRVSRVRSDETPSVVASDMLRKLGRGVAEQR